MAACPAPPIRVAHSLSCALVDHWVARHDRALKGALLVAPADVDSDAHTPPETRGFRRSEEHTSELQSLMRISYAVFCLKKKTTTSQDLSVLTTITYSENTEPPAYTTY